MAGSRKPLLRVVNLSYPEVTDTYTDLLREGLGESMRIESRSQMEVALRHPERYRGVFLETLRVRTGNTRPSKVELYGMGNGVDIVRMDE